MKVPVACIVCGQCTTVGNRCAVHRREYEKTRSVMRMAYRDPLYMAFVKSNVCKFCGSTENLTKDHIVPLSRGGTNHPSNIQTLCRACNSAKRDRLIQ